MKKRVSSQDVATEAGVSRAMVSYVLNDVKHVKIKDETRQRIIEAADKLGYHPDSIARAMKTNKSMSIGVVSRKGITEERFFNVLGGIQDILKKHDYNMLITSNTMDHRGYPEYYRLYKSKRIDGILFLSDHETLDQKTTDLVTEDKIPSVFMDYHSDLKDKFHTVDIDYASGAEKATTYALEQGYRKIVFITPESTIDQNRLRKKGVKEAIKLYEKQHNTTIEYQTLSLGGDKSLYQERISQYTKDLLKDTLIITAWIAHGYLLLQQIYEQNKDPKDYGILALAGNDFANMTYPRLTTCDLPLRQIGKESTEMLLSIINQEVITDKNRAIPCQLNVRDSL